MGCVLGRSRAPPAVPTSPILSRCGSDSLKVVFYEPNESGWIEAFQVEVNRNGQVLPSKVRFVAGGSNRQQTFTFEISDDAYYSARVKFCNENGWGEFSCWSNEVRGLPPSTSQAPSLSLCDRHLKVNWTAPSYGPVAIKCEVQICNRQHIVLSNQWQSLAQTCPRGVFSLTAVSQGVYLSPNLPSIKVQVDGEVGGLYVARVRFQNIYGWSCFSGESNLVIVQSAPPQPQAPLLEVIDAGSIRAKFVVPRCEPAATVYRLKIWELDKRGVEHPVSVSELDIPSTLQSPPIKVSTTGSEYKSTIQFKNIVGWSQASQFSLLVSFARPPTPSLNAVRLLGPNTLLVSWEAITARVPLKACHVVIRVNGENASWRHVDANRSILVESPIAIAMPASRCIVNALYPGKTYEVKARFSNAAGWGDWSPIVSAKVPHERLGTKKSSHFPTSSDEDGENESEDGDTFAAEPSSLRQTVVRTALAKKSLDIIFVVDESKSMGRSDIPDNDGTRIDMVLDVLEDFIKGHKFKQDALHDTFTLIMFSDTGRIKFEGGSADDALRGVVSCRGTVPRGPTNYEAGLGEALKLICSSKRPIRVVLLSDGRPGCWNFQVVNWFQRTFLREADRIEVHTVGFGPEVTEFEVLQQLAQLGCGGFQLCSLHQSQLRRAFTSISDTLTVTRTGSISQRLNSRNPVDNVRALRDLDFTAPLSPNEHWCKGLELKCLRHTFAWDADSQDLVPTSTHEVQVCRRRKPHAKGNMRYVYAFWDSHFRDFNMVSKESLYKETSAHAERCFVRSSACASYYATHFTQRTGISVEVLTCHLYEVHERTCPEDTLPFFCGEQSLPGVFVKWVGNAGYINNVAQAAVAECFCHFTYHWSNQQLMVSDLQGVIRDGTYVITDPQVLSRKGLFGRADIGLEGMRNFMERHRCGELCQRLRLDVSSSSNFPSRGLGPAPHPQPDRNVRKSNRPGTQLGDRLHVEDLFYTQGLPKKMLFVGECTLSFSSAASKLRGEQSHLNWTVTELRWPNKGPLVDEKNVNARYLRSRGAFVVQEAVDARLLRNVDFLDGDGIVWSMPYPDYFSPHAGKLAHSLIGIMRDLLTGYVTASAQRINLERGRISVVVMSYQHLSWALRHEVVVPGIGTFVAEMRVFSLDALRRCGYQPRFGDCRDELGRTPSYPWKAEAVVIQWRHQRKPSGAPVGMSDTRLRRRM